MSRPLRLLLAIGSLLLCITTTASAAEVVAPTIAAPVPRTNAVVSVGDFFVDENGAPVTPFRAFQRAVDAAREREAATLLIPPGRYVFDDPGIPANRAHLILAGLHDLTIDGQGAELVFTNPDVQGITLVADQRIVLRRFSIEWDARLASAGIVQKQSDGRTAIRFLDRYPAGPTTAFESVSRFDIAARQWSAGGPELFHVADVEMVAPQTFVAPEFAAFADGAEVLVRHRLYTGHAIGGYTPSLSDVALEDLTVYSAPGMAFFFGSAGHGIRLTRCIVQRKGDALISTASDGAHFTSTGGGIVVEDCDFSGMGDDAINVSGAWFEVLAQPTPTTLELGFAYHEVFYRDCVGPESDLTFRKRGTLAEWAQRTVVDVTQDVARRRYFVTLREPIAFDDPSATLIGALGMASSDYVIRNNRFHDHRARGMLLQAPRGRVENNVLDNPTQACLNITGDSTFFYEGFGADDVVVTGNRFRRCNAASAQLGTGQPLAAVNIFADTASGLAAEPLHHGLVLAANEIVDTPGLAILVASAMGVTLANNTIVNSAQALRSAPFAGEAATTPPARWMGAVLVTHASDVTIRGLALQSELPAYDAPVYVDATTTKNVVVQQSGLRRAAGH